MKCKSCKEKIPAHVKFCPACGAAQQHAEIDDGIKSSQRKLPKIIFIAIGVLSAAICVGLVLVFPLIVDRLGSSIESGLQDAIGREGDFEELISVQDDITSATPTDPSLPLPTIDTNIITPGTATPTETMASSGLVTPSSTPIPRPASPEIRVNDVDKAELVLIPAGEFTMGSDASDDPYFWGAEGPAHLVYVDSFWIYRTEVTNSMYARCAAEQKCPKPVQSYAVDTDNYYGNPNYDNYPVIYVTYTHASAYCGWAGGRLPTEAEWEKAARGTGTRLFPWGNDYPDSEQVNLCDRNCARGAIREDQLVDGYSGTSPVGRYPAGASPYGALDMAGNVWEWTFDWFQSTFYTISPYENPNGPISGERRVLRGGSWSNSLDGQRVVARISEPPETSLDNLGFRCVLDVDPE